MEAFLREFKNPPHHPKTEPVPNLTGSDDEAWTERGKQEVEEEGRNPKGTVVTKKR